MSLTEKQLLLAFKAIGDPTRLQILRALKQKGRCSIGKPEGMCARDIEAQIKLTQPTISHHMAVLTKAGLVFGEKHGLWVWYRRNEKSLRQVAEAVSGSI